jgi:hypothetical protein
MSCHLYFQSEASICTKGGEWSRSKSTSFSLDKSQIHAESIYYRCSKDQQTISTKYAFYGIPSGYMKNSCCSVDTVNKNERNELRPCECARVTPFPHPSRRSRSRNHQSSGDGKIEATSTLVGFFGEPHLQLPATGLDQPLPPRKRVKSQQSPDTAETPVLCRWSMTGPRVL